MIQKLKHYWALIFVICTLLVAGFLSWIEGLYTGVIGEIFYAQIDKRTFLYLPTGLPPDSSCLLIPFGFLILWFVWLVAKSINQSRNTYKSSCLALVILLISSFIAVFLFVFGNIGDAPVSEELASVQLADKTYRLMDIHFRALEYRYALFECDRLSLCHALYSQKWDVSNKAFDYRLLTVDLLSQPKSVVLQIGNKIVYTTSP
jgi:hypothetical protein